MMHVTDIRPLAFPTIFSREEAMTVKRKYNWLVTRSEAAELLRRLADSLEEGRDEVSPYDISLTELAKVKIKIDLGRDDVLEVKFSGKEFADGRPAESGGAAVGHAADKDAGEDYSALKKRMQTSFAAMRDALARGELPASETVAVFLSDSEMMQTFGGSEAEAYPAFALLCARLRSAADTGSLEEMSAVVGELARSKKACHAKFK